MATPSSDEIAKLVGEIRELKNSLDDTSVDRAEIGKRYNDAMKGLLTANGEFDATAWSQLSADDQATRAADFLRLKQTVINAIAADPVVRIEAGSIMYKKEASNGWIIFLAAFALLGLGGDLWVIGGKWTEATSGKIVEKSDAQPTSSPSASPVPKASAPVSATTAPVSSTDTTSSSSSSGDTAQKVKGPNKPTEGTVLYMVMLLGALGGFLRLASSVANYVGNRQLLQSWIIYYLLTPIQGAALAPVVYLLLRVGVLNPANPQQGTYSPTDSLNLIGIYAFAALTGLFSKQAIEMLADVFSTIFKKVNAKDALEKAKPDAGNEKNKPAKSDAA